MLTITGGQIYANTANNGGGGVFSTTGLDASNNSIHDNTANNGGGVYLGQPLNLPIGFLWITSDNNIDPNELLGYGEWQQVASGRTLVGVSSTDTDFDAAKKTGGTKTAEIAIQHLPSHRHDIVYQGSGGGSGTSWGPDPGQSGGAGSSGQPIGYTGGGQQHNNLAPYITVNIWERIA